MCVAETDKLVYCKVCIFSHQHVMRQPFFSGESVINYSYFLSKQFSNEGRVGINLESCIMQIHSFSDAAARTFDNWEIQRVRLEVVACFLFYSCVFVQYLLNCQDFSSS